MAQGDQSIGATGGGIRSLSPDGRLSLVSRAALTTSGAGMLHAISVRRSGPGGLYNLGNAVGLGAGLLLAVWSAGGTSGLGGAAAAMADYLAGSGSAVALTLATLIFFWGGEAYHRAWANPQEPDSILNRQGDLLSALGALVLGVALALLGNPLMAATAGFLHAAGKLGSALHRPGAPALPGWPGTWPEPFRSLVLLSRIPALLVALLALGEALSHPGAPFAEPLVLLVCTALWAKADLMLFGPAKATLA